MIHHVIKKEDVIHGIKMSKKVELVHVTRQEIVVLPKTKPIVAKHVPVAVKVRYNEPKFN